MSPYREFDYDWAGAEAPTCERCRKMVGAGHRLCLGCDERVVGQRLLVNCVLLALVGVFAFFILLAFQEALGQQPRCSGSPPRAERAVGLRGLPDPAQAALQAAPGGPQEFDTNWIGRRASASATWSTYPAPVVGTGDGTGEGGVGVGETLPALRIVTKFE